MITGVVFGPQQAYYRPGGGALRHTQFFPIKADVTGPVCYQVQQQTTSICFTGPRPLACTVYALSLPGEDLNPYAFPSVAILSQVVEKLQDYHTRK